MEGFRDWGSLPIPQAGDIKQMSSKLPWVFCCANQFPLLKSLLLGISEQALEKTEVAFINKHHFTSATYLNIPLAFIILYLSCVSHTKHKAFDTYRMPPEAKFTHIYIKEKQLFKTGRKIYISNILLWSRKSNAHLLWPFLYHTSGEAKLQKGIF